MYTSMEEKMAALNAGKNKLEEIKSNTTVVNAPKTQVIYQQPQNVESKPQEVTFMVNRDMKPITAVPTTSKDLPTPSPSDIKM